MENQPSTTFTRVDEPLPCAVMGEYVDEQYLTEEIDSLWASRESYNRAINDQKNFMRSQDERLSEMLYTMKAVLSKPGRSGGWSSWLKERQIPRATADRLVVRYLEANGLTKDGSNCLNESTKPEPTEAQIGKLLTTVHEKCERVLVSPWSRYAFIKLLANRLGLTCTFNKDAFIIRDPEADVEEAVAPEQQVSDAAASVDSEVF
jgi:hypothetical protein